MCGIIGVLAYGSFEDKKQEKIRQESMIFLASELLQLTQPRGKDATGIATLFESCDYMGLKMGISAQEFVTRFGEKETDFEGYLNVWRKKIAPARIVIGHCRKPSTGTIASADDNVNNHPIKVGDIIGVHNGTLTNHEKIFEKLNCGRDGKVDSEAIFRLLHHFTQGAAEPFSKEAILETCKRLSGQYAVLSFNGNNPYQLAAFRDGRPIELAILRSLKLALIASEKDIIKMAVTRYMKMAHLYQTSGLKFMTMKKKDMDIETLPDDSLFLFDVRHEITDETKLSDLYITEKIPRTEKVWSGTTAKTTTPATGTHHTQTAVNRANPPAHSTHQTWVQKKAEVNASAGPGKTQTPTCTQGTGGCTNKSSGAAGSDCRVGYAWNHKDFRFQDVDPEDVETAAAMDAVVIDGEEKKVVDAADGTEIKVGEVFNHTPISGKYNLPESDKPADDLVADPAKIEVAPVNMPAVKDTIEAPPKETLDKKVTMDMETYPDAIKLAEKATREQLSFSTDQEVVDTLEISDADSLKHMEIYSLANRIKNFFFKAGFYAGYVARSKEEGVPTSDMAVRTMMVRARNKANNGQKTIRNIKTFVKMLASLADDRTIGDQELADAIQAAKNNNLEMNLEILDKVFRPGDRKNSKTIEKLMEKIGEVSAD